MELTEDQKKKLRDLGYNPDDYEVADTEEPSSRLGAIGRGFLSSIGPSAVGALTGAAGAGIFPGPLPVKILAGLGTGAAGAIGTGMLQNQLLPESFLEAREKDIRTRPNYAFGGELAGIGPFFRGSPTQLRALGIIPARLAPKTAAALAEEGTTGLLRKLTTGGQVSALEKAAGIEAGISGGVGGGMAAGEDIMLDRPISLGRVAAGVVTQGLLSKPTSIGRGLLNTGESLANRITRRNITPPTPPPIASEIRTGAEEAFDPTGLASSRARSEAGVAEQLLSFDSNATKGVSTERQFPLDVDPNPVRTERDKAAYEIRLGRAAEQARSLKRSKEVGKELSAEAGVKKAQDDLFAGEGVKPPDETIIRDVPETIREASLEGLTKPYEGESRKVVVNKPGTIKSELDSVALESEKVRLEAETSTTIRELESVEKTRMAIPFEEGSGKNTEIRKFQGADEIKKKVDELGGPEQLKFKDLADENPVKAYENLTPEEAKMIQEAQDKHGINVTPIVKWMKLFKRLGVVRNIRIEFDGSLKTAEGSPANGVAVIRQGLNEALIKINPNTARPDTWPHELFHIFLRDLLEGPSDIGRNLVRKGLKIAGMDQSKNVSLEDAEEILTEMVGRIATSRTVKPNALIDWLGDFWSFVKTRFVNGSVQDYSRLLANKLLIDAPFNETFAPVARNMDIIAGLARLSPDEFLNRAGGDHTVSAAIKLGTSVKSFQDFNSLAAAREFAMAEFRAAVKAKDYNTMRLLSTGKLQFFKDALEAATGTGVVGRVMGQAGIKSPFKSQPGKIPGMDLTTGKNTISQPILEFDRASIQKVSYFRYLMDTYGLTAEQAGRIAQGQASKVGTGNTFSTEVINRNYSDVTIEATDKMGEFVHLPELARDTGLQQKFIEKAGDLEGNRIIQKAKDIEEIIQHPSKYQPADGGFPGDELVADGFIRKSSGGKKAQIPGIFGGEGKSEPILNFRRESAGNTKYADFLEDVKGYSVEQSVIMADLVFSGEATAPAHPSDIIMVESNLIKKFNAQPADEVFRNPTKQNVADMDMLRAEEPLRKVQIKGLRSEIARVNSINSKHAKPLASSFTDFYELYRNYQGRYINSIGRLLREKTGVPNMLQGVFRGNKDDLANFLKEDSPIGRRIDEYLDDMQDTGSSKIVLDAKEKEIVDDTRKYLHTIRVDGNNRLGLDKRGFGPDYYPQVPSRKAINTLVQEGGSAEGIAMADSFKAHQVKLGKSEQEAEEALHIFRSSYGKRDVNIAEQFGPVDKAAGIGIPREMREHNFLQRLTRYGDRIARRYAFHDTLQADIHPEVGIALQELGGNQHVRNIYNDIAGVRNSEELLMMGITSNVKAGMFGVLTGSRDFAASLVLGMQHMTLRQTALSPIVAWKNAKENWEGAYAAGSNRKNFGSLEFGDGGMQNVVQILRRSRDIIAEVQGRNFLEQATRATDFGKGKFVAMDNLTAAHNGKLSKQGEKFLNDFGGDWRQYVTKGEFPVENLNRIASRFVDSVQGTYDFRGQPRFSMEGQLSPYFAVARWSIEKANNFAEHVLTPMVNGNFRPFIMQTVGMFLGGLAAEKLLEIATGRKSRTPRLSETFTKTGGIAGLPEQGADNIPLSVIYRVTSLASLAGYGGMLSDLVNSAMAITYGKDRPQEYSNVMVDFMVNNFQSITDLVKSIRDGDIPTVLDLTQKVLEDHFQNMRIAMTFLSEDKKERIERGNQMRDLRVFHLLRGDKLVDMSTDIHVNPFLDKNTRDFKRTSDPKEALKLLPALLEEALNNADGSPEKFRLELTRLKGASYPSFPSPESVPESFIRFVQFLDKTQGRDVAIERLREFLARREVNRAKTEEINLRTSR